MARRLELREAVDRFTAAMSQEQRKKDVEALLRQYLSRHRTLAELLHEAWNAGYKAAREKEEE